MKTLTDEQIKDMISDIVSVIDYDIWKDLFPEDVENVEDVEFNEEIIYQLTSIVKKYIK